MHRRSFLAGSIAGLAAPSIARAATAVLRMVPQANLTSIDSIWTTANLSDLGTVILRRAGREPIEEDGWLFWNLQRT